jgi:uncharacterized protein YqeY
MLRDRFNESLKQALRNKQARSVSTIRLIIAALKDRDIAARGKGNTEGISEDEILAMLQTMVKQRQEAIALYEQGGRLELAEQEQEEIDVIKDFLPEQLGEQQIVEAVNAIIAEVGATGLTDMKRIMGELRQRYAGRMDFGKASGIAKAALS